MINENLSKICEFGIWLIQWFGDFSKDIKALQIRNLNSTIQFLVAPPKKVHKCFSHMKTLELEIVQGFFFYPHYAFRYIFVKLDFANSVAFFKAFEKAINMHHTSLFFSCLTIPISGVKK